jgi:hypothetical protein
MSWLSANWVIDPDVLGYGTIALVLLCILIASLLNDRSNPKPPPSDEDLDAIVFMDEPRG